MTILRVSDDIISAKAVLVILVLAMLAASTTSIYLSFFLLLALMPSFAALIVEKNKKKYLFKSILGFNIFGALPYLELVLKSDHYCDTEVLMIITHGETWTHVYCCSLLGVLAYFIIPLSYSVIVRMGVLVKIQKLKAEISDIDEDWK